MFSANCACCNGAQGCAKKTRGERKVSTPRVLQSPWLPAGWCTQLIRRDYIPFSLPQTVNPDLPLFFKDLDASPAVCRSVMNLPGSMDQKKKKKRKNEGGTCVFCIHKEQSVKAVLLSLVLREAALAACRTTLSSIGHSQLPL